MPTKNVFQNSSHDNGEEKEKNEDRSNNMLFIDELLLERVPKVEGNPKFLNYPSLLMDSVVHKHISQK